MSLINNLYIKLKKYYEVNDEIISKVFKYNKIYLVLISRDVEEYMSGHRSKTRIFLAIITQICIFITLLRISIRISINKVSFFCECY